MIYLSLIHLAMIYDGLQKLSVRFYIIDLYYTRRLDTKV